MSQTPNKPSPTLHDGAQKPAGGDLLLYVHDSSVRRIAAKKALFPQKGLDQLQESKERRKWGWKT